MKQMRLADLVLDFEVYPRVEISSYNVTSLAQAIDAGVELPPMLIDEKTKRIVDGFHRYKALTRMLGEDAVVEVMVKRYKNEAELFADAVRLNATHGHILTKIDRVRCVLKGEELGLSVDTVIRALGMTKEAIGELRAGRVGTVSIAGGRSTHVPLKRTIHHMSGQELTEAQVEANGKLGGMDQAFYVNQVIILLKEGLLDTDNPALMRAIDELTKLLNARRRSKAAA